MWNQNCFDVSAGYSGLTYYEGTKHCLALDQAICILSTDEHWLVGKQQKSLASGRIRYVSDLQAGTESRAIH